LNRAHEAALGQIRELKKDAKEKDNEIARLEAELQQARADTTRLLSDAFSSHESALAAKDEELSELLEASKNALSDKDADAEIVRQKYEKEEELRAHKEAHQKALDEKEEEIRKLKESHSEAMAGQDANIADLVRRLEALGSALEVTRSESEQLTQSVADKELALSEEQASHVGDVVDLEQQIHELNATLNEKEGAIEQLKEGYRQAMKKKAEEIANIQKIYEEQIAAKEEEMRSALDAAIAAQESEATDLKQALSQKDGEVRELKRVQAQELGAREEELCNAVADHTSTIHGLQRQIQGLHETLAQRDETIRELREGLETAAKEKNELIADHETREREILTANEQMVHNLNQTTAATQEQAMAAAAAHDATMKRKEQEIVLLRETYEKQLSDIKGELQARERAHDEALAAQEKEKSQLHETYSQVIIERDVHIADLGHQVDDVKELSTTWSQLAARKEDELQRAAEAIGELKDAIDQAVREREGLITSHEARREGELRDLKRAIDSLAQTFGDHGGAGPGFAGCVEEIMRLRDAHLDELRQADDALRSLGSVMAKLKQELGAARSALLSHSGQGEEEEEDVERPSASIVSRSGGKLEIRKILGSIDELTVELGSAHDQAVQLSGPIAEALERRVPEPEASVSHPLGLRIQAFASYVTCLGLIVYWLYDRQSPRRPLSK
jgi:chromosome segregation ATPase